jgi:hypothetical protein
MNPKFSPTYIEPCDFDHYFDIFQMHLDGKVFKNLHIFQILPNSDIFDNFGRSVDKGRPSFG